MKKFYFFFTLLVALCCSTTVSAKKIIYSQNFETAKTVAETGWTSPSVASGLSIGSDDFGKFLKFTHSANDRSAHMFWDADKIKNELSSDLTAYTVSFQFCFNAFGNNHMTSEIAVMSDKTTATKKANSNYRVSNGGALFDLTQLSNTGKTAAATGDQDFAINGDSANYKTLTAGVYYNVTLTIDTLARTVEYTIQTPTADDPVASDTYTVPEGVDMTATGLYILAGRYAPVIYMDNIEVSVDKTEAAKPWTSVTPRFVHETHRPPAARSWPEAARPRDRLPLGRGADLRHHRALHHRGSLRGRRRHRAQRHERSARRTGRPAVPGRLPLAHGRGTGPVRLRRRRRRHRRQAGAPSPACLRR
jgi:hypothetical protein